MFFNGHIVVMAVHHFFGDFKLRQFPGSLERADKVLHHERAVGHREVLRPMNRFDVIVKVVGPFRQIGQILVRKVDHPFAHILPRQFDEKSSDPISHAPRSTMQHEPNAVVRIEANFDEVVSRP